MWTSVRVLLLVACQLFAAVSAQESVNAHEGFNTPKQAGLAILVSFSALTIFANTVNLVKRLCIKQGNQFT